MNFPTNDDQLYHYLSLLGSGSADPATVTNLIKLFGQGNYSIGSIITSKKWFRTRVLTDIQRLCNTYCKASLEISALSKIVNNQKKVIKNE